MAFAISEFKSNLKGGGAKSALFQVDLSYPSVVNTPTVNAHFLISAASIPASTVGTYDVFYHGKSIKVAADRAYDNWETMKLINRYSSENNLPLISSSAIGFHIQILLFENKKNKHLCLECVFPNQKEPKLPRCDTVGILGTVAGLAGLISAQKTINYIMDFGQPTNLMTIVDCKSLSCILIEPPPSS